MVIVSITNNVFQVNASEQEMRQAGHWLAQEVSQHIYIPRIYPKLYRISSSSNSLYTTYWDIRSYSLIT